jgi:hypothetical protein
MAFEIADTPVSVSYYSSERTRFFRLQKVGYAERTGRRAVDSGGFEYEVMDLHIRGTRYAIRLEDLARAIAEHGAVRIEEITREWRSYLGAACGLAQVSASKKGFNIELFDGGQYTTPLAALCRVMENRERSAPVAKIPEPPVLSTKRDRRISPEQQRLAAFA